MPSWSDFRKKSLFLPQLGFSIDFSRVNIADDFFTAMRPKADEAFAAMQALEKGAIANPDEKRMVGHYWLRDSARAPSAELKRAIEDTLEQIRTFSARIHGGEISNASGKSFKHLLLIGIGGSALGPQFVNQSLRSPSDKLDIFFFDNTDPDGMDRVLSSIPALDRTLVVVISKSGGTKETRNGQFVAKEAFEKAGLSPSRHFIAVTGDGSELDKTATAEKWLARFPMWDWVGGRTSEFSAVGLLPAALQGFDITAILAGARSMDEATRVSDLQKNPSMLLALMWHAMGKGRGEKDMVILPYKDRIELFSRYLQQLVMESLGKELDLSGKKVNQGIAVYGNKGSTDQHAYVQQLRDGVNNFFVVFINVLVDSVQPGLASAYFVEPGITSGDYLSGFYQGTRKALYENDRQSVTITVNQADAACIGQLIALFERAVGYYASLVNINAYHQPGVEAGKKAATEVLAVQKRVMDLLSKGKSPLTVEEIASTLSSQNETETIFHIVRHLAANGRLRRTAGASVFDDRYAVE